MTLPTRTRTNRAQNDLNHNGLGALRARVQPGRPTRAPRGAPGVSARRTVDG
jgi:hypothetical protein